MPNPFLEAALTYAIMDYRVFPCAPRGKRPITERGFKDATTDLEQIERWWTENPDANVAVATGDGLLVIDPDRRNGGDKTLETLEAAFGPLPRTCVAKTSDGIHIWLRYDGPKPPIRKSWPGVDFKHDGGYVVVAPSIHPSGVVYSFESFGEPARLPESWAAPMMTPEAPSQDEMSEDAIYTKCKEAVLALPECVSGSFGHNAILRAACEIARWGVPPAIAHAILREYNETKCFDKDGSLYPWDEADLKRKLKEGHRKALQAGEIGERLRGMKDAAELSGFDVVTAEAATAREVGPVLVNMQDVVAEETEWLWKDRIPQKAITLMAGDQGTGKTFIALDAAARVSTGTPWPDGSPCETGKVLLITAEDGVADTLKPRLVAMGANCENIIHLEIVRRKNPTTKKIDEAVFSLQDLKEFEEVHRRHPDIRLVAIDPIGSFTGGKTDAFRDNEVRAVLAPVALLARTYGFAVLVIAHSRKDASGKADDNVMGSRAFTAIARSVWHVLIDPDNKDRRLFLAGKCNLARQQPGLAYAIVGERMDAKLVWEREPIRMNANDGLAAAATHADKSRERGAASLSDAEAFLLEALSAGPRPTKEIEEEARNGHCISAMTLRRARKSIGVEAFRPSVPGPWYLRTFPEFTDLTNMENQS